VGNYCSSFHGVTCNHVA